MSSERYRLFGFTCFLLASLSLDAASSTWGFTLCTNSAASSASCLAIRTNTIQELCEAQVRIRPDKYYSVNRVYLYDPNSNGPRAYCYYNMPGGGIASNHAKSFIGECGSGSYYDMDTMGCITKDKPRCEVGNPIDIYAGVKKQFVTDYELPGFYGERILLNRYYQYGNKVPGVQELENIAYGGYWKFSFTNRLFMFDFDVFRQPTKKMIRYSRPQGEDIFFYSMDGVSWENKTELEQKTGIQKDADGNWELENRATGEVLIFNSDGWLVKIISKDQSETVLSYIAVASFDWNTIEIRQLGHLIMTYKVVDRAKRVVQAVLPSGAAINYEYDLLGNMSKVVYPNGVETLYHYEDSNFPKALTGITDERGVRYATWAYDAQGRAISSEHAGGTDKTLLAFNADGSTTVTNPLGKQTTYHFDDIAGARRVTQVEGHATPSCEGANQNYTYTPEGWLASKSDWKGNITTYSYNTLGQEISRTEAFGTPQARTHTTEWHSDFYVKTRVVDGGKETLYTYDDDGRLLSTTTNPLPIQ